jgi:hypothetical protein
MHMAPRSREWDEQGDLGLYLVIVCGDQASALYRIVRKLASLQSAQTRCAQRLSDPQLEYSILFNS